MNEQMATAKLKSLYATWINEVKASFPEAFSDVNFSNPYFIGVPHEWFTSKKRVLVVFENGFGRGGNYKDKGIKYDKIGYLMRTNLFDFEQYMKEPVRNEHPYWTRFRNIKEEDVTYTYTAMDKIAVRHDTLSNLKKEDRIKLHSIPIKILAEEINILKPTLVFFFGWHESALKIELPSVYEKLYPNGEGDDSLWLDTCVNIEDNGVDYIFSYSPFAPYWKNKPDNYEKTVYDLFIARLNKKAVIREQKIRPRHFYVRVRNGRNVRMSPLKNARIMFFYFLAALLISTIVPLFFYPLLSIVGAVLFIPCIVMTFKYLLKEYRMDKLLKKINKL